MLGLGVDKSFPRDLVYSRNTVFTSAQTTWLPLSFASVRQKPSRNQPVSGFIEQVISDVPSTLFGLGGLI